MILRKSVQLLTAAEETLSSLAFSVLKKIQLGGDSGSEDAIFALNNLKIAPDVATAITRSGIWTPMKGIHGKAKLFGDIQMREQPIALRDIGDPAPVWRQVM